MPKHALYLSIGSNIGNRKEHLSIALNHISESIGTVVQQSSIYETEAWGMENQRGFFNQILFLETELSPDQVLAQMLRIENEMGRVREKKWASRKIDIDILFYDNLVLDTPELTIPHHHMHDRNFILVPLLELAPELVHPVLKKTIREIYFGCKDKLKVFLN